MVPNNNNSIKVIDQIQEEYPGEEEAGMVNPGDSVEGNPIGVHHNKGNNNNNQDLL